MNCPECGNIDCAGAFGHNCTNLIQPPEPDIYDAVSHFRMNTKPAKPEIGHMYRHGYDGPFRIWNGTAFQQVNPTPQESIDQLVEKFREQYRKGFTDGANAVRQVISGELSEVREYLLTLTDDDTSYAKRERMLNAVTVPGVCRGPDAMQTWLEIPESENVTALSVWNQYVVSHRPSRFTLSYRPDGSHVHVGVFPSLEDAKQAAVEHSRTAEQ